MILKKFCPIIAVFLAAVLILCSCVFCYASDDQASVCNDTDEAAKVLRKAMKHRKESVAVCLITDTAASKSEHLISEIFEKALEHSGKPSEGDYLRFQYDDSFASAKPVVVNGENAVMFVYEITYYDSAKQEKALKKKVKEIISGLDLEGKTDAEKTEAVYRYMCDNVEYDYDNLPDQENTLKYTAYAALVEGKAVCQGYSAAMYRLLLEAGVDNRIICGKDSESADAVNDHTWNIVRLGDEYYNLDVTKDDELGEAVYYLRGSGQFDEDHIRMDEYKTEAFTDAYKMSGEDYTDDGGFARKLGAFIYGAGEKVCGLFSFGQ